MEQLVEQMAQRVAFWTLYHWAAFSLGVGLVAIMLKGLYEEMRYNKSIVGRFFILCATASVLLVAAAAYQEVTTVNGWRLF